MAIRERKGRACPWQCYWNNPYTGKRESVSFATRKDAKKHDSLIKHRLRFERESFRPEPEEGENEPQAELTLESVYLLYLREKQFSKKSLQWQLDAMRPVLAAYGNAPLAEITTDKIEAIMQQMLSTSVKPVTVRNRLSVLRTILRWAESKDYMQGVRFPKLPPAQYERFVPPSPAELAALLAVAPQYIQRMIIIGAQCGACVGRANSCGYNGQTLTLTPDRYAFTAQRKTLPRLGEKCQYAKALCRYSGNGSPKMKRKGQDISFISTAKLSSQSSELGDRALPVLA